jgi:hypothetical protein
MGGGTAAAGGPAGGTDEAVMADDGAGLAPMAGLPGVLDGASEVAMLADAAPSAADYE